jgi:hypothetical protein
MGAWGREGDVSPSLYVFENLNHGDGRMAQVVEDLLASAKP